MIPRPAALAAAGAALALHNVNVERLPGWLYVPANLATAGAVLATARAAGIRPHDLGLSPAGLVPGLLVGAPVAAAVVALGCHPGTRPLFADRRLAGVTAAGVAYRAAVRIPLGTVVLEEVAFRGVLPALAGAVPASLAFGAWHVVPTAAALDVNRVTGRRRLAVLAGTVAATTAVGLGLCRLRRATGGLLAPAIVHAAATSTAVLVAGLRPARSSPMPAAPAGRPRRAARRR